MRTPHLALALAAATLADPAHADYSTPVAIWYPPPPICVSRLARLTDGSVVGACSPQSTADPTRFFRTVDGTSWTLAAEIPWFPVQTLVPLASGGLLVDSGSALRRSNDGGRTWSPPFTHVNGMLVGASSGRLVLLVDGASTSVRLSTDGGGSWTTGATLAGRGYAGGFVGPDTLVACQGVTIAAPDPDPRRTVDCQTSRDGGVTFDPAVTVARTAPGATQPMTFALASDDVVGRAWVATAADALRMSLTSDAGASWLPATTLTPGSTAGAIPAVRAGPGGDEVWAAGGLAAGVALFRATDGVAFAPLGAPPDTGCDPFATPLVLPAGTASFGLLLGDRGSWTTPDGGTSWDRVRTREPEVLSDPALVRAPSGRLLAAWVSAKDGTLASLSDDGGTTWTAPAPIPGPPVERPRAVAAALLSGGGFALARQGNGASGCGEVAVFTSPDGAAWSAGVVVATLLPPTSPLVSETTQPGTPGIAEDGSGRLGLVFRDGLAVKSVLSLDGGATWSVPATIFTATAGTVAHSPLRQASDGALVFLSSRVIAGRQSLEAWTSRDGGLTFTSGPVLDAGAVVNSLRLWTAGSRLRSVYYFDGGVMGVDRAIESRDAGASFTPAALLYSLAGAPDGTFYGFGGFPERAQAEHLDLTLDDLGASFQVAGQRSGVEVAAGLPCWAYRTFTPATPGLYFTCFGASLHPFGRDDSIRMLSPRPPLAPLFPLAAWTPTGGGAPQPGFTDTPLETRPLVFYGLAASAPVLRMSKSGASAVRLYW